MFHDLVEFAMYLKYTKDLRFTDRPDYDYLVKLFKDLFARKGYKNDGIYEWTPKTEERNGSSSSLLDAPINLSSTGTPPSTGIMANISSNINGRDSNIEDIRQTSVQHTTTATTIASSTVNTKAESQPISSSSPTGIGLPMNTSRHTLVKNHSSFGSFLGLGIGRNNTNSASETDKVDKRKEKERMYYHCYHVEYYEYYEYYHYEC